MIDDCQVLQEAEGIVHYTAENSESTHPLRQQLPFSYLMGAASARAPMVTYSSSAECFSAATNVVALSSMQRARETDRPASSRNSPRYVYVRTGLYFSHTYDST